MKFHEAARELAEKVIAEADSEFMRQHSRYEFKPFTRSGEQITDGGHTFRVTVEFEPSVRSATQLAATKN